MNETKNRPVWLPLQDAIHLWDEVADGIPGALDRAFSEALASGAFTARGVCIDGRPGAENSPLTVIPPEHFRQPRTFRSGRIESWSDVTSAEQFAQARNLRARHPDWEDVVFHTADFIAWLTVLVPGASENPALVAPPVRKLRYDAPEIRAAFASWQAETPKPRNREQIRKWAADTFGDKVDGVSKLADYLDRLDAKKYPRNTGRRRRKSK